ncbi:MAG: hypothetical protein ACRED3_06770 [Bradyrhizobium sp.]
MTAIKFLSAAVLLALIASPASALNMIEEPGMFAFVYPNGDLGLGTSRPPADAMAMTPRLIMRHPLPARHGKAHR